MTLITDPGTQLNRVRFFIDGRWADPRGSEVQHVLEAATEETIAQAAMGTDADIDAAVRAARTALDEGPWGHTSASERAEVMERFAAALLARADSTSTLVSRENGMPITLSAMFNGAAPAGLLQMYAQLIRTYPLEEVRPGAAGSTIVRREPVGVVGAITAWNYPQVLAMVKIAPALAAGCTVVLKPSPETALDSYVIADAAIEAGLPPGVLNIVVAGREAGASLVSHPLVDKIAFTGSTAAGRVIGAECGRLIRRVSLELGGKSAAIFLDDGDIDAFRQNLGLTAFLNNSQTCTTQARVLAPRSRYDEVIDAVASFADDLVVGDPLDPATTCGPMASSAQLDRVLRYVDIGKRSGARLVTGGGRPPYRNRGYFVEPTVFADVDNRNQLAREEVFGPVIAVIPYDGDDEAIAIANDSNYGLAGSVWSADEARGLAVGRRVRTGTIGVNNYNVDFNAPYGGMKDSGIGREMGPEALESYVEYKSLYINDAQAPS
jgi:acyl-CoA reductase-like NAD-dependent aldehyde dehydrogenase